VYAIVMRTLTHFERALGRRLSWSFGGHQLKVAPHAFAEPNAYYSKQDEGILFGYFAGRDGPILTCLSHDIVVHETTHALVDGLRPRLMEPSSPDQAAFHEAFADVVALLSVFSLPEVVAEAVRAATRSTNGSMVRVAELTVRAFQDGMLFGLGEQFGDELSGMHGSSLRRSIKLKPDPRLLHRWNTKRSTGAARFSWRRCCMGLWTCLNDDSSLSVVTPEADCRQSAWQRREQISLVACSLWLFARWTICRRRIWNSAIS
jgi:hypothetical protein